jgi:hypothetical protein
MPTPVVMNPATANAAAANNGLIDRFMLIPSFSAIPSGNQH